jgi:hypothetical protein
MGLDIFAATMGFFFCLTMAGGGAFLSAFGYFIACPLDGLKD